MNIYRIESLSGSENYQVWKVKMIDILTDIGYIDYVDGTPSAPDPQAATYAAWAKKDRLALSMIRLRVAGKLIVYVSGATTSQQAWKTLKDMYEARGPIGIVLARRKFFRSQCEDTTSIEEHIRTLRQYQEELHNLGQKIGDPEFAITLLTSLPESWNPFISAIDTTALSDASAIIARVLEEDWRMKSKGHDETALPAFRNRSYPLL